MRTFNCVFILLLIFLYCSCKDGVSDCFKRNGKQDVQEYEVSPFRTLYVNDDLHVSIVQGSPYKVTVKAGSHIIAEIKVKVEDGVLSLRDEISCDWVRKYEPKEVIVQSPDLRVIYQNGYGSITAGQTLTYDSLFIRPRYGQGTVSFDVNAKYVFVESHRNGTVTLTGKTDQLFVGYLDNNAIFDGKDLKALYIDMVQKCNNSLHLYPIYALRGQLLEKGNVYLYHTPDYIQVKITGKGKVINKSDRDS